MEKESSKTRCAELARKRANEWYRNNTARANETMRKYRRENKDKISKHIKEKRKDPIVMLNHRVATSIRKSITRGKCGNHWETLVGFTLDDIKRHLEKHFLPGMSWENRSEWHIDHKTPIAAFNFQSPDDIDFKKCWKLSNLQPLWKADNRAKWDKVEYPFQPSLAIGS